MMHSCTFASAPVYGLERSVRTLVWRRTCAVSIKVDIARQSVTRRNGTLALYYEVRQPVNETATIQPADLSVRTRCKLGDDALLHFCLCASLRPRKERENTGLASDLRCLNKGRMTSRDSPLRGVTALWPCIMRFGNPLMRLRLFRPLLYDREDGGHTHKFTTRRAERLR